MGEKMLLATQKKLRREVESRKSTLEEISKAGAAMWDGDGWHSSSYRIQQTEKEVAIRVLQQIEDVAMDSEIMDIPKQNDKIEMGHMVKVRFMDDDEILEKGIKQTVVHLLGSQDRTYLGNDFDNLTEMVVSVNSPLGKALLGGTRGQEVIYNGQFRVRILKTEDAIQASSLFNLLEG